MRAINWTREARYDTDHVYGINRYGCHCIFGALPGF